ncbi:MAG: hypothetical protein ACXWO2_08675 [Candidatus Limnocylindrales bacterium]
MRIFGSTLRKLLRRPATWITGALVAGLLALVFIALGATLNMSTVSELQRASLRLLLRFPDAYGYVVAQIISTGGLFAVIFAAAVAGSEWQWGTLKSAVARGESRSRYMVLTLAGVALLVGVAILFTFVVSVGSALVGGALGGLDSGNLADRDALLGLPGQLLRCWLALTEELTIGFAVATLTRSQLAGVGAGIALFFGSQFATLVLPDLIKYFPFNAAAAVVTRPSIEGVSVAVLPPNEALLVTAIWLVGAVLLVVGATERAEITG